MKRCVLVLALVTACVDLADPVNTNVCGPCRGGDTTATAPIPEGLLLVLGTALDYSSSSVDAALLSGGAIDANRIIATGDAALRKLGDQAVVLNRGSASSLQVIDSGTFRGAELSLDVCNPHDIEMAQDAVAIATCYDGTKLKLVDFDQGSVTDGPDLVAFADGDGLPEADQLLRVDNKIYVTLQRLDRNAYYTPVGNAKLAVIDAETLTLDDEVGIELPCQNPFSDLALTPDGKIAVACVGDFVTMSTQRVVTYDPQTGDTHVLVTGELFGGTPASFRMGSDGAVYLINSVPDAFSAEGMQLVRVHNNQVDVLYEREGYSLSGIAVTQQGAVYVGDRSLSGWGVYRFDDPSSAAIGPLVTSLPPYELEVF